MPMIAAFRGIAAAGTLVLLVTLPTGCSEPVTESCQRYDALSLNRENGFAARLDWKRDAYVDLSNERIEVAISALRPLKGPIELVHLVGEVEADRWTLVAPELGGSPVSLCTIQPPGSPPGCRAVLQNVPFWPGGYYALRAGDNVVLEAGISFFLCE